MGTVIRLTESQLKNVISRIINETSVEKYRERNPGRDTGAKF